MLELALFAKPAGAWLMEKFGSEVISRWTAGQRCSRSTGWCGSGRLQASPDAKKFEALGNAIRADYNRWLETENAWVTQIAGRPIGIPAQLETNLSRAKNIIPSLKID